MRGCAILKLSLSVPFEDCEWGLTLGSSFSEDNLSRKLISKHHFSGWDLTQVIDFRLNPSRLRKNSEKQIPRRLKPPRNDKSKGHIGTSNRALPKTRA